MGETPAGPLQGKVAVVTGAASGIGRATALTFLERGASVLACDLNETAGAALMEAVPGDRRRLSFRRVDVVEEPDVAGAVAAAREHFGRLDVMVNNAGVPGAFGPVTDLPAEDWDYTFSVLARGAFLGVKHAAAALIDQGDGGAIVNVASIAAFSAGAGPQAYSAAKAAVVNLTQSAAVELAPHHIRVNAVCPGVIRTPFLEPGAPQDLGGFLGQVQPWPEAGQPEDVARVLAFLASEDAGFVTGEAVVVDGGLEAAGPGLARTLKVDPRHAGLVGVSRGSTGEASVVHRRLDRT
ncbi:MAG TPA: SDR family NAD(P)-dependent oxidoreductase [Acidimicrobiales bacterium]|nr:SDR family NAD(P)-dependent oxidoreductase [Acidimicrobiales bacterium]